jgi:hypothetical protein
MTIWRKIEVLHVCCSFGLIENHKKIDNRGSLDARTFSNCRKAAETISRVHLKTTLLGSEKTLGNLKPKAKSSPLDVNCVRGQNCQIPPKTIKFHDTRIQIHAVESSSLGH